jgi:hypothetical protein
MTEAPAAALSRTLSNARRRVIRNSPPISISEHQFCRDLDLSRVARAQYLTEIGIA